MFCNAVSWLALELYCRYKDNTDSINILPWESEKIPFDTSYHVTRCTSKNTTAKISKHDILTPTPMYLSAIFSTTPQCCYRRPASYLTLQNIAAFIENIMFSICPFTAIHTRQHLNELACYILRFVL